MDKYINDWRIRYLFILIILLISMYFIAVGNDQTDTFVGWIDAILVYIIGVRTNNGNGLE